MEFRLTHAPIDTAGLLAGLASASAGACVTFEGRVRDLNEGRPVTALEYEAYGTLAEKEGEAIMAETAARFPILGAVCVHRTGKLGLGDVAVWVAVTAAHRGAAFEACRHVIDQVKLRVPIWKKEYYADGASEWINSASGGQPPPAPTMK
jgi:molybdopterin synthase catalytic subunit